MISSSAITSIRNPGSTGPPCSWFHFLIILTSGFHCPSKSSFAVVASSAWILGLVGIQIPR